MESTTMVLVVDDDTLVRVSMVAYLEDQGFALREAGSAAEALEIVRAQAIDVMIVDLRLRDGHGEDLIVAASEIRPELRFLIYTGSLDYEVPERLCRIGLSNADILPKPLPDMQLVVREIQRLAGNGCGGAMPP